ncbi:MAG TPA: acyl-ACP--UDP-N-acetylglucosamine O-acyltransferase [Thermoanaerobaculia bacterium]|nr:acyl-ACP--UDP-N-acetylglucosamine O-acyltransferase [Thermoanaerobaculia bacterium]
MAGRIHPTAIIDESAVISEDVEIGAWAIIEADVQVGRGCVIGPWSRIEGPAILGERNRLVSHCSIGSPPQDLKFQGEKTELRIGDDNVFREFVTVNRGTAGGGGSTTIGSSNFFMAYAHVAHDCHVGSHCIFGNAATLAGHVEVADHANIGAFAAVHQFCRVGAHAFIGGFTVVTQDVLPYVKTVGGREAKTYGVNTIGLQRRGLSKETISAIDSAYRLLIRSKLSVEAALERIENELPDVPEVRYFAAFVRGAKRGLIR